MGTLIIFVIYKGKRLINVEEEINYKTIIMRKIVLFAIALFATSSAFATDYYLYLDDTSGNETSWAVSGLQKLTFSGSNVLIHQIGGTTSTYPMSGISRLHFETTPTAISSIEAEGGTLFDGTSLKVNAKSGSIVSIYSASGTLVSASIVGSDGIVSIGSLPSGVYLVKTGNVTSKIMKK